MLAEHADLDLVPFSQRIKSLLPLLRAQNAFVVATPSTAVDFVRKVESIEEADRVVREMENRSDQVEAALKKQIRVSSSSRHHLGGTTGSVGVSSSSSSSSHRQGGGGGDEDVEMQQ